VADRHAEHRISEIGKERRISDGPASSAATGILNDADPSSIEVSIVQLGDGILHVSQRRKLRNPATQPTHTTSAINQQKQF